MNEKIKEQKQEALTKLLSELKEIAAEKYALINQNLQSQDEYIRLLYIKLLCTTVQYENVPTESQELYLKRVVGGLEIEGSLEEHMRKSLDISETDLREFLSYMKDSSIRFYFVLDGLILSGMCSVSEENREYLAQLIEVCNVTKKELQQLCMIAKSVIQQDPALFDEAKKSENENIVYLDFTPYVQNYYTGAIIDTDEEKYYYAPEKERAEGITFPERFHALRKVRFNNLKINLNANIVLESCEEVCFKECDISGGKFNIKLLSCGNISFENCRFSDFSNRVLIEEQNGSVTIRNCSFTDCVFIYSRNESDWKRWGCVIYTEDSAENGINNIINCIFKNCGGRNRNNYYSSAFVSNARSNVSCSTFYSCWHYRKWGRGLEKDPESTSRTMFLPDTPGENNQFYDCADFC